MEPEIMVYPVRDGIGATRMANTFTAGRFSRPSGRYCGRYCGRNCPSS